MPDVSTNRRQPPHSLVLDPGGAGGRRGRRNIRVGASRASELDPHTASLDQLVGGNAWAVRPIILGPGGDRHNC